MRLAPDMLAVSAKIIGSKRYVVLLSISKKLHEELLFTK